MPGEATVIGLLGPVAVGSGSPDDLRPVAGLRARRLLVALVLADGRTCSSDRLIDEVWAGDPPRSPSSALHTQVSRLRPLLGTGHIEAVGNGYRLTGCRTDLDIVAGLAASSGPDDLDAAEHWWRGDAGDDLGDDDGTLTADVRGRAVRLRAHLDRSRLRTALDREDFVTARTIASALCRDDPLDETVHVDLMRAYAGEGRTAEALSVFARLRRALSEELGVDPGPSATALHAELLAGEGDESSSVPTSSEPTGRSRRGRVVGLAGEASEIIGRDTDIDAIAALVGDRRLVTIQGPGGVGKTRVAGRVGHAMADAGRPVYFVPLAPVRDAEDVVLAMAAALGVGEVEIGSGGRPRLAVGDLADRLVDAVRGERAVVILDNCEHVVERCAQVVADLLAAEPTVSVLTTSRSPLQLAGEHIYQLPVLDAGPDGPAVALFERRARAIRPDAYLPRDAMARLCRHLDGLPLAIELAAARIRTMSLDDIGARLDERFALLRGTDRTAPDRHRTLYAVIEWSWELLDSDARTALWRLCRFPSGFTAEAAGIVLGFDGVRLDDVLEALVNQSLLSVIEVGGRTRFRMLETVREFGEEQLSRADDPGESSAVNDGMRRWARDFAIDAERQSEESIDAELFDHVAVEVDNLVWVVRQCTDSLRPHQHRTIIDPDAVETVVTVFPVLGALWMARGLHGEIMTWGRRLIRILPRPPENLDENLRRRWQFTVLASSAHLTLQRDLRGMAIGRARLRNLHREDSRLTEPTDLLSACALSRTTIGALRLIWRAADEAGGRVQTSALTIRMNVRENHGDLEAALADGHTVRTSSVAQHDTWLSSMGDISVGMVHGQQCDWEAAVSLYRSGIVNLRRLGARDDEVQAGAYLVAALIGLGRMDEARVELERLADGWHPDDPDPRGNPEVLATMMLAHAEYDAALEDTRQAAELYWRAAHLLDAEHPLGSDDPGMVMLVSVATIGLVRLGDADRAREFLPVLADGVAKSFGPAGWHDMPQCGVAALAAGLIIAATEPGGADAPRLLALSRVLRARRDFPSTQLAFDQMMQTSGLSAAAWDALRSETATLTRRQAADEVRAILAPRLSKDRRGIRLDQVLRM